MSLSMTVTYLYFVKSVSCEITDLETVQLAKTIDKNILNRKIYFFIILRKLISY